MNTVTIHKYFFILHRIVQKKKKHDKNNKRINKQIFMPHTHIISVVCCKSFVCNKFTSNCIKISLKSLELSNKYQKTATTKSSLSSSYTCSIMQLKGPLTWVGQMLNGVADDDDDYDFVRLQLHIKLWWRVWSWFVLVWSPGTINFTAFQLFLWQTVVPLCLRCWLMFLSNNPTSK